MIKKKVMDSRKTTSFKGRTYVNYNRDVLNDHLTNAIKASFRAEDNPIKCWDLMENFLCKFLDEVCPMKTYRTKECTPAWLTHDLITLSKDRDRMWVRAIQSNKPEDWAMARQFRNWSNNAAKAA